MSFLKKASLLTIPTAYKQGKLYSVKPDDGSGDFTFTRSTSATRVNSDGLIESVGVDVPRIDYSSGTPSLLLEPQRTNLVLQSEDFGNYININSTDVSNVTISPEGFTNATSFLEAATTGQHKLFTSFNFDGTSTYTFSIFAKHNGRDLFIDTQDSNEWSGRAWFDLTNGTANAILGTAAIEDFGNGWYRCIVTGISNIAGANFVELLTSDGSTNSTTGDITKGVYIYGCQLEQGSYATSYIPTYGTSVTRTNEFGIITDTLGKGLITATEFTLFIDLNTESLIRDSSIVNFLLGDAAANGIFIYNNALNAMRGIVYLKDSSITQSVSFNTSQTKICIKVQPNNVKVFINGIYVYTFTSLNFDFTANSNLVLQSGSRRQIINNLLFFPTALSDAECITLTTI